MHIWSGLFSEPHWGAYSAPPCILAGGALHALGLQPRISDSPQDKFLAMPMRLLTNSSPIYLLTNVENEMKSVAA